MDTATRRSATRIAGLAARGRRMRRSFVAIGCGRITAPFGDSDEGINGAVWALERQSLRDARRRRLAARRPAHRRQPSTPPTRRAPSSRPPRPRPSAATARGPAGPRPGWRPWPRSLLLYRLGRRAAVRPARRRRRRPRSSPSPRWRSSTGRCSTRPIVAFPFGVARDHVLVPRLERRASRRPGRRRADGAGRAVRRARSAGRPPCSPRCAALALAARALRHRPGALRAALPYLLGGAVGVGAVAVVVVVGLRRLPHAVRQVRRTLGRVVGRRARRHGVVPAPVAGQPARPVVRRPDRLRRRRCATAASGRWPPWRWRRSSSTP